MNKKALGIMLADNFLKQWGELVKKSERFKARLKRELDEMRKVFGNEVVDQQFAIDFGQTAPSGKKLRRKSAQVKLAEPPQKPKRRKRRQKSKRGTYRLSYTKLRSHAVEAIKSFPLDANFNTRDVQAKLEAGGLAFRRNHLRVILVRDIAGLEKIGTTPREGKKQPANIYKITGPVQLHTAPQDLVAHA